MGKIKGLIDFPVQILKSKKLVLQLAKNDFKTKYAGSYLGIIWAFIQPVITVVLYWFVFQMALNVGSQFTKEGIEVPYVLWLVAGLVPWFYFQDALNSGTNALIEYSYLVKKVVFNISVLPIVKITSALFVHIFFCGFMILLYACYGYLPNLYTLQIIYYSVCMIVLVTGIVYLTSSVVIFFRDLSQLIVVFLQIGIWMTPIMWNIDIMNFPPILTFVLKANPMYYIVSGYRDSMINQIGFWERPGLSAYFWIISALLFVLGTTVFKKLRVHFADVL